MQANLFIVLSVQLVLAACSAHGQNLVPNGGFEEYVRCPGSYNQGRDQFSLPGWTSPSNGTPDHFHACSIGEADVPYNWAGVSDPFEGNGYVGIYVWHDAGSNYREYLQSKLHEPLVKDSTYNVSFFYKLSSYSRYSIDRIGLLLEDSILAETGDRVINRRPTLAILHDSALTKKTGLWEKASMVYKAKGGEQFVVIGNFFSDAATDSYRIKFRPAPEPMLANHSYYFIDQVQVVPKYWPEPQNIIASIPEFSVDDVREDTKYVLKNIQFAFDSYRLIPPSFYDLDELADFMIRHPRLKLQLFGHTDDQGSERYNLKLSRDRAKNVAAYLNSVGVAPARIEYFGLGKSQPLVNDTTETARAQNRRVEIKFIR